MTQTVHLCISFYILISMTLTLKMFLRLILVCIWVLFVLQKECFQVCIEFFYFSAESGTTPASKTWKRNRRPTGNFWPSSNTSSSKLRSRLQQRHSSRSFRFYFNGEGWGNLFARNEVTITFFCSLFSVLSAKCSAVQRKGHLDARWCTFHIAS